jgi:DNA-binding transcriptional regulator YiaG
MSMKSELQERLERLAPGRVVSRPSLPLDATEAVGLEAEDWVTQTIPVAKRLMAAGAGLRDAHAAINDLAARKPTVCRVAKDTDFAGLAADLRVLNVTLRRRPSEAGAGPEIAAIRARHALSQRDFADRLGIDVRTLQNWEQGRNRPDPAALTLIRLFDRDPAAVLAAVFGAAVSEAAE